MTTYQIQLKLLSDTTFSRGDGVAGLLDREVEHDAYGHPFLHGRTLKGLLGEEADNFLDALQAAGIKTKDSDWEKSRNYLFGVGGSDSDSGAGVHYSHAQLPDSLRQQVEQTMKAKDNRLTRQDVLASLTVVRRQTAVNGDGLPHEGSLRAMRVILRNTVFTAELTCERPLEPTELMVLAASVMALRRAGTGRNRGRGYVQADLLADGRSILEETYHKLVEVLP